VEKNRQKKFFCTNFFVLIFARRLKNGANLLVQKNMHNDFSLELTQNSPTKQTQQIQRAPGRATCRATYIIWFGDNFAGFPKSP
jgi:hypothetical protein